MERPMHDMLCSAMDRLSLHMPGHRGVLPFFDDAPLARFDTTELPMTDDLYEPRGGILRAQALMAQSAKAGATVFLHGGSTAGIQSMMLTYLKPNDKVILPRNAHHSAISACVIGGFEAVFAPMTIGDDDYACVLEETFLRTIAENPDAKAVLVTRPDYYGGAIALVRIAGAAHERGMKLMVDEAHGAHFNWMKGVLNAGRGGADAWVQSAHKTLPAINAAAMMHFMREEEARVAARHSRLIQTSSPSFMALQSLDDARAFMVAWGEARLEAMIARVDAFCEKARALGYQDKRRQDRTRLVLSAPQGGKRLADELAERGIDIEMYDRKHIICILSVMDDETVLGRLLAALETIKIVPEAFAPLPAFTQAHRRLSIREAYFSPAEWVPIHKAAGRTAGAAFGLYPPGIPLAAPGETITDGMLFNIKGMETFGTKEDCILCLKEND